MKDGDRQLLMLRQGLPLPGLSLLELSTLQVIPPLALQ